MVEPLLMDAATLISATSNVSSEEEFDQHLEENLPTEWAGIAKLLIDNLGDEINFSALHAHLGVKGRIHGDGLNLALKTLIKYWG